MYGLSAITETASDATRRLALPRSVVTNAAPSTRAAMALSVVPGKFTPDRIWGSLPVEDVEGHTPDPAYDVRPIEGLGRAPIRSERLGLSLMRELDNMQPAQPQDRALARPAAVVAAGSAATSSAASSTSSPPALGASLGAALDPQTLTLLGAALGLFLLLKHGRR